MTREPDFVDECYADKDLSLLKKLTLVIPTYNRNYYLSRCLWYHAHFPFGEIIVADSSPEEKKVVNRETVEKVREMFGANVRYLEYEPETEKYGGDIYRKWGDAVQHVGTEYSVISIDKAFIMPETYIHNILSLESDNSIGAVTGMWYWIDKSNYRKKNLAYLIARDYTATKLPASPDNPTERYCLSISSQLPWHLFSIHRSHIHKRIYTYISDAGINDIRFGEVAVNIFGDILCKTKYTVEIDLCRDVTAMNRGGKCSKSASSSTRYPYMSDYVRMGLIDQFYPPFATGIHDALKDITPRTNEHDVYHLVEMSKGLYLPGRRSLPSIVMNTPFLRMIWIKSPSFIKQPLRGVTGYNDKYTHIDEKLLNSLQIIKIIIERTKDCYSIDFPMLNHIDISSLDL